MQTITNLKQYTNEKWFKKIGYKTKDNQTYYWVRCKVCNNLQAHLIELDNGEYISITENCIYCKNQIVDYMRELTDGELENMKQDAN